MSTLNNFRCCECGLSQPSQVEVFVTKRCPIYPCNNRTHFLTNADRDETIISYGFTNNVCCRRCGKKNYEKSCKVHILFNCEETLFNFFKANGYPIATKIVVNSNRKCCLTTFRKDNIGRERSELLNILLNKRVQELKTLEKVSTDAKYLTSEKSLYQREISLNEDVEDLWI